MGPTGNSVNVIQIHPTLRCNLRCQHCYSTSGPEQGRELPVAALEELLAEVADEGFNAVGVSGGEPLTYRHLPRLLASARARGLLTTVTTNGVLLTPRRIEAIAPHVSVLAISIDGGPESHDRLRGVGVFERMQERLADVRAAGIPFGFVFTLTLHNLHELAAVAEFAVAEGARLLQVHPLERVGRARDYEYELVPPDDVELAYAFMEVARLQRLYVDQLTFQLDVADRPLIEREPCRAFAIETPDLADIEAAPLASLVSPLVLQEDGAIVPIQHGFAPEFAVAHLGRDSFRAQAARWKRRQYPRFLELCGMVWGELRSAPEHLPFTNWYAAVTQTSQRQRLPMLVDRGCVSPSATR
jgi:pyruvate-formate lyase-activating enzyme